MNINGPSWEEEVVPALRKRLEGESRTLAKRLSAVSLASQDDHYISMHADPITATYTTIKDTPASPFLQSNASATRNQFHHSVSRTQPDRLPAKSNSRPMPNGSTTAASTRQNSSPPPGAVPTNFQRSRTYSQPYLSDVPNGHAPRPKTTKGSVQANGRALRSPDIRPTRIPQPAGRSPPLGLSSSVSNHAKASTSPPFPNGNHNTTSPPTVPQQAATASAYSENNQRIPISIPRSSNVNSTTNVGLGLLNESPPFNPASASSSVVSHQSASPDLAPPRPSVESDERPFEHWYRGEVSRNGGVGELRVGRRQEMLDIANYGHTIRARERARREELRTRKKRADSVSGIRDGSRERSSLYLDDEDAQRVGQVLDEAPLTDLDGSEAGHHGVEAHDDVGDDFNTQEDHTYGQEDDDTFDGGRSYAASNGAASPQFEVASRSSHDTRSTTPTPAAFQTRPESRSASVMSTRIPSRTRQSSESRAKTPTQMVRAPSAPPPPSSSPSPPPPPQSPQPSRQRPQQQQQPKSPPAARATSKTRTPAGKARAKALATKKELDEEAKRKSMAYYPTPGEEGDETIIDAIPEWTQPVPHRGNWDDVVLPVVARKKGLEEHYQKADGKPAPRPANSTPAPAPGTFGYDHSKYRAPHQEQDGETEDIPMHEFGPPSPEKRNAPPEEELPPPLSALQGANSSLDYLDQPWIPPRSAPSPAPFSDYAPTKSLEVRPPPEPQQQGITAKHQDPDYRKEETSGGCCCVIM
ncbi:hypothetical protein H0H92_002509 [Tricholoma furcatifolium]|nr:hypothetical protein H0H92_002509 [Tricholoma furcatifolium]